MLLSALFAPAFAEEDNPANILVLTPKLNAAYDRIFGEIIKGIESYDRVTVYPYDLMPETSPDQIQEEIDNKQIDAIIALGQASYDTATLFHNQLPVIHGGMVITPGEHSGISLAGSPEEFFFHLNSIAPSVKRVFTIYSKEYNGWIIDRAKEEARKYEIELHVFETNNSRQSVNQFRNILEQASGSSDAVWLLLDKLVPQQTILPLALDAAWKDNIVIFSSNPLDSKRGALFSLFPDHNNMGYRLAELSLKQIEHNEPTVWPLSGLKVSVNKRTASHIGFRYTNELLNSFDIVYPKQ